MDAKKHKFVKTMDASAEKTWQAMKKRQDSRCALDGSVFIYFFCYSQIGNSERTVLCVMVLHKRIHVNIFWGNRDLDPKWGIQNVFILTNLFAAFTWILYYKDIDMYNIYICLFYCCSSAGFNI